MDFKHCSVSKLTSTWSGFRDFNFGDSTPSEMYICSGQDKKGEFPGREQEGVPLKPRMTQPLTVVGITTHWALSPPRGLLGKSPKPQSIMLGKSNGRALWIRCPDASLTLSGQPFSDPPTPSPESTFQKKSPLPAVCSLLFTSFGEFKDRAIRKEMATFVKCTWCYITVGSTLKDTRPGEGPLKTHKR